MITEDQWKPFGLGMQNLHLGLICILTGQKPVFYVLIFEEEKITKLLHFLSELLSTTQGEIRGLFYLAENEIPQSSINLLIMSNYRYLYVCKVYYTHNQKSVHNYLSAYHIPMKNIDK